MLAGWLGSGYGYLCPTSEIRHRGQATMEQCSASCWHGRDYSSAASGSRESVAALGYFVISGVSWSSHHEKKGRGQPRPRTNWAAIGLVPLHSGKGRTKKETYWVLAGLSIAGGNPAKACT